MAVNPQSSRQRHAARKLDLGLPGLRLRWLLDPVTITTPKRLQVIDGVPLEQLVVFVDSTQQPIALALVTVDDALQRISDVDSRLDALLGPAVLGREGAEAREVCVRLDEWKEQSKGQGEALLPAVTVTRLHVSWAAGVLAAKPLAAELVRMQALSRKQFQGHMLRLNDAANKLSQGPWA